MVDRLTRRPVPRPFSPPPLDHRSRPSRDDGKPAPRDRFATSSNDVRRRCCAADVEPCRQDRSGSPRRVESRSSGIRSGSTFHSGRPSVISLRRDLTDGTAVRASIRRRRSSAASERVCVRADRRTDSAFVVGLRRRSELVEVRTRPGAWRRGTCSVQGRFRRRTTTDGACTVPRPQHSKNVGRRSRTVRRGRGEEGLRVVARRSGTVVQGRRGKRSRDGTACVRPSTTELLRVGSETAERRASPPFNFWLGRACPVHRAFFPSALSTRSRPSRVQPRTLLPAASSPPPSTSAPRRHPTFAVPPRRSTPRPAG